MKGTVMTRIHINASTPYDVVIEEGALQRITDYIKPLKPNCRVIIVSDSNVAPHYLDSVKANMEHAGYTVCDYVFPAGESSKNAHQLIDLVEYMAAQSLTRKDLLIALGGGVVGDMAGFAAATYVPGLLTQLEHKPLIKHRDSVSAVIARCVQAKADIVEQDERESGVRALLNLGHTFGHGIEKASHFEVHHGYAVAIGMVLMAQGAVKHGELDAEALEKLKALIEAHDLPTTTTITKEEILAAAKHDKKSEGATIKIVVPTSYGHSELKVVTHEELATYLD